VTFIDPAAAIARRVLELMGPLGYAARRPPPASIFTSGKQAPGPLLSGLCGFGFHPFPRQLLT
jgi:hypothetical protein